MTPNRRPAALRLVEAALVAALASSGCDSTISDNVVPEDEVDLAPCGFGAAPAARIDVSERNDIFHAKVFSRIDALVLESPSPAFHQVVLEEGGCRYYEAVYGECDPPCAAGELCTADDECLSFPETVSGGRLTINGLADPITIDPESYSPGTYTGPAGLPEPLFDATQPIRGQLEGDVFPAVTLTARGVALMDRDLTATGLALVDGEDLEVTWTPGPDEGACVQLVLNGRNPTHGAPLDDIIRCEGTDTGSLVVPQAFVERFPHGATPVVTEGYDWPHSELTRYYRSATETERGPAELIVRSTTYFQPRHPE